VDQAACFPGSYQHGTQRFCSSAKSNDGLRRAIQIAELDGLYTQEDISNASVQFYLSTNHAGLTMQAGDYKTIVNHAVASGNNGLWQHFIARHSPYIERKGPDETAGSHESASPSISGPASHLGAHRTGSSRAGPSDFVRFGRSNKSYRRMEAKRKENHFADLQKNRAQIEAGQHWGWLRYLAQYYLYGSDEAEDLIDDPKIAEKALLNCFDFLAPMCRL